MAEGSELAKIDAKVSALLAIAVDRYLRETGIARPKERSIDKMLKDVGLPASDIAALLGKTDRAVHKQLESEAKKKQAKKSIRKAPTVEAPEGGSA